MRLFFKLDLPIQTDVMRDDTPDDPYRRQATPLLDDKAETRVDGGDDKVRHHTQPYRDRQELV